jgi:hypothetical protein
MMTAASHPQVPRQEDMLARPLILRIMLVTVTLGISLCIVAYLVLWGRERELRPSMQFPERDLPAPHTVAGVRQAPFALAHRRPTVFDQQRAALSSYQWVDRSRGLVRIPVERAMDLVAGQVTEAQR